MFDPDLLEAVDRITDQYAALHDEVERIWAQHMVFTWHWWLDVALAVLPWILWFIVRDRKNSHNLFYAGLFTAFMATVLCMIGTTQSGWNYNTWLLPFSVEYLPWDWTIMPVVSMLFYQYWPRITGHIKRKGLRFIKSPWIAALVFGGIAAYAVEPVFILLGLYEPSGWEHHYSLPIYAVIYITGWWLYTRKRSVPGVTNA